MQSSLLATILSSPLSFCNNLSVSIQISSFIQWFLTISFVAMKWDTNCFCLFVRSVTLEYQIDPPANCNWYTSNWNDPPTPYMLPDISLRAGILCNFHPGLQSPPLSGWVFSFTAGKCPAADFGCTSTMVHHYQHQLRPIYQRSRHRVSSKHFHSACVQPMRNVWLELKMIIRLILSFLLFGFSSKFCRSTKPHSEICWNKWYVGDFKQFLSFSV